MKKFLIFVSAFLLSAGTMVLKAQNPKENKQVKKSSTVVKDETQKPMVKDETKTISLEMDKRHPQTTKKGPPNPRDHKRMRKSAKVEKTFEKRVDPDNRQENKERKPQEDYN